MGLSSKMAKRRDRYFSSMGLSGDGTEARGVEFSASSLDELPEDYQFDMARLLLKDRSFALDFSRHFDPFDHLDHPHLQWACHLSILWWERHQANPRINNIRNGIDTRVEKGMFDEKFGYGLSAMFENVIFKPLNNDADYIKDQSKRWLKRQVLEGYHLKAGEHLEKGEDDEALGCFEMAAGVQFSEGVEEESYLDGTEASIVRRNRKTLERIPLGLGLDTAMAGGVDRQTLTLFGAPSDVGKTTISAAVGGHVVESGYKVAHASLETPLDDVRDLYDSRFTGVLRNDLGQHPDEIRALVKRWQEAGRDPLRICRWKPFDLTPARLREWLNRLRVQNFRPDFLIVDSPDEMVPYQGYSEGLYLQSNVTYLMLIGILADYNVAGFITSQTNRETYGQAIIRLSQLSDSLNKARRAHTVIFGAQTDEMRSANPFAYVAAILAKQKKGKVNMVSPLECDYARTRFTPVSVAEMECNLGTGFNVVEAG